MIVLALVLLLAVLYSLSIRRSFGNRPSGTDLFKNSPNYRDGTFQNLSETRMMEGSMLETMKEFFTSKGTRPDHPLPSVKTSLLSLPPDQAVIIWFGHSSYLIHVGGKNILVDPVFSNNASPVSFFGKSFEGTGIYSVEDLPEIDIVLITHDHYDHLDHETIRKLQGRARQFYTPLGVGSHLIYWGVDKDKIVESDWWQSFTVFPGIELIAAPARHFSGRSFSRNRTLWSSYILKTPECTLYLGGDSGYDSHFREIGEKYGPFDLVILECGQYDRKWPFIHMMPEETVQACVDLRGKVLLPVHWGRFTLSVHSWTDPIQRALKKASELDVRVTTPMIGEPVVVGRHYPERRWWDEAVKKK